MAGILLNQSPMSDIFASQVAGVRSAVVQGAPHAAAGSRMEGVWAEAAQAAGFKAETGGDWRRPADVAPPNSDERDSVPKRNFPFRRRWAA